MKTLMEIRSEVEGGLQIGICMVGEMMNGNGWGLVIGLDTMEKGKEKLARFFMYEMLPGQEWTLTTTDYPQYQMSLARSQQEMAKRFNNTRAALIVPNDPKAEHGLLTPMAKKGRAPRFTKEFLHRCGITGLLTGPDGEMNV